MATVQRVSESSVGMVDLPSFRPVQMTGNESRGLERGLDALAQVTTKIGEQAQERADTAQVLEARRKLGDWERSWFDPKNPSAVPNVKGKDSMGLVEQIDPDFEKVNNEIMGGLRSDRAREAYMTYAAGQRESILSRVNSYAVAETDKYVAEEFKASITNATDRAAQAALEGRWDDQAREVDAGFEVMRSLAKMTGESPEVSKVREQAFLSTVHGTAVNGMLARGDVSGAGAYFHDNADDMSPEVAGQVMARLRPMQNANNALAIVDGIERGGILPGAQGIEGSVDSIWDAQLRQESGNKQTTASGAPVTSPNGAIGVAQVMPGTGPIAAQYAGLPWDPVKFKTDRAYNEAIGKAYMKAQVDQFGSLQLGLAAYNAGPGAVQNWIARFGDPRKGQISIDEFVERIPYAETKGYVQGIMAKSGAGTQASSVRVAGGEAPVGLPPNATLEQKIQWSNSIADPQLRGEVQQELRSRHSMRRQAEAETEAATLESVNQRVYAAPVGMSLAKILQDDPATLAFVTQKGHRDNYERIVRDRIEGVLPKTNPILFEAYRRMSVEDPEGFIKQKNAILAQSHQFAAPDYEMLLGRISTLQDAKKAPGAKADWSSEEKRIGGIVRELGIKAGKPGEADRAAVTSAYTEAERAFIQTQNRAPNPVEKDELARAVKRNLAEAKAAGANLGERGPAYETFTGSLDLPSRQKIAAALRERLGQEPSEAQVIAEAARIVQSRKPK